MGYSVITLEGDGETTTFPVAFTMGYLSTDDVKCRVGNEVDEYDEPVYRELTWASGNSGLVTIGGAVPGVGESIVLSREVDKEHLLYDFQKGEAIDEVSLDESHKQLMMAVHEMLDGVGLKAVAVDIDMQNHKLLNLYVDESDDASVATVGFIKNLTVGDVADAISAAAAAAASATEAAGYAAAAQAAAESVDITYPIAIDKGGTGQTEATAAIHALGGKTAAEITQEISESVPNIEFVTDSEAIDNTVDDKATHPKGVDLMISSKLGTATDMTNGATDKLATMGIIKDYVDNNGGGSTAVTLFMATMANVSWASSGYRYPTITEVEDTMGISDGNTITPLVTGWYRVEFNGTMGSDNFPVTISGLFPTTVLSTPSTYTKVWIVELEAGVSYTPTLYANGDQHMSDMSCSVMLYAIGPAGPKGDTGDTGAAGADGSDGADGAAGADGTDGVDGRTILNGTVDPTASDGVDNDFWINTTTHTIFGPKASGSWPATGTSLVGPAGADGADGTDGAAGQDGADGADGTDGTSAPFYLYNGTDAMVQVAGGVLIANVDPAGLMTVTNGMLWADYS